MKRCLTLLFTALGLTAPATASDSNSGLQQALQNRLNQYLSSRAKIEHISAISLSISLYGSPQNINLTAGTTQYGGAGAPVTPAMLWQIGSNTKAFTAAAILQLEAEGKLTIDQTVGKWLPQYPAWKNVTIRRLLDMTSGIPGYDFSPDMLRDYAAHPMRNLTIPQLIAYAYPGNKGAPPPTTGYSYSNTNYLLAELIIERASHDSYANELKRRFFSSDIGLTSTYYSGTTYPADILSRMVSGYFFNHDADNAGLAPLL
jgi:D-alanyl-D-alanine carboxypeptidase